MNDELAKLYNQVLYADLLERLRKLPEEERNRQMIELIRVIAQVALESPSNRAAATEPTDTDSPPPQIPGCLPRGYDVDSMLTPKQFCVWQQVTMRWFNLRRRSLPGVVAWNQKMLRIHPRTYLADRLKRWWK